ncbi:hypothetical protein ACVGOW_13790 [Pseudonocardia saturnea]
MLLALDAPPTAVPGSARIEFAVRVDPPGDGEPGPAVRVIGPVDTVSAGEPTTVLLTTSRGGSLPVTVDLTEVTLPASAGVLTLRDQFTARDRDLQLVAPPGTPAWQIPDLVGLAG